MKTPRKSLTVSPIYGANLDKTDEISCRKDKGRRSGTQYRRTLGKM